MNTLQKIEHESDLQPSTQDRLLRASDVQRELGISRATAYRMMTDGTLPAYRFSGRRGRRTMVRVSCKDLREWREAHKAVPSEVKRPSVGNAIGRKCRKRSQIETVRHGIRDGIPGSYRH
jgi:excisionase family DNA binding protein